MTAYDENLTENKFYCALLSNCPELYETAADNRWTFCIPRAGSIAKYVCTEEDFLNHILVPLDKDGAFKTASDKELSIQHNVITTGSGFKEVRAVPILFEETFFNKNDDSFRVLCVNSHLEGEMVPMADEAPVVKLHNLEDCIQLLWGQSGNTRLKKQLDDMVEVFNKGMTRLEGKSLRYLMDAANSLYTKALHTALKDPQLKAFTNEDKSSLDSVKLAVETYIMHSVNRRLFRSISTCLAATDAHLNKVTRNLSSVQLQDLDVRTDFSQNVPRARKILSRLNSFSTPLGKLNCIRLIIMALMQPPKNGKTDEVSSPLTTDDLLPILIFMVVKAEIPNWWANLTYMNSFHFSKASNDDEYGYYLTSMEAAIRHVHNGELNNMELGANNQKKVQLTISPTVGVLWQRQESNDKLDRLFQCISDNQMAEVEKILRYEKEDLKTLESSLCHPLCACDKCMHVTSRSQLDPETVTAFSRDERGFTVLHVSCGSGHVEMTELLITRGAIVNAIDYQGLTPLHVSCQRGHQSAALLLLHHKAKVNLQDNEGNTPLHLAAGNGHEECVKALIYYDQGSTALNMNLQNEYGDTALHHAARWGYAPIIENLLENGAAADIKNRRKQIPQQVAPNVKVAKMLAAAVETQREIRLLSSIRQSTSEPSNLSFISPTTITPKGMKTSRSSVTISVKKPSPTKSPSKVDKLLTAVADGDIAMVRHHLGWAADSDDEDVDLSHVKLCHPLCQCDKCKPVQKLTSVASDIQVNSSNKEGMTPLLMATMKGHADLIQLFLKRGANINAKTGSDQMTSLHIACQQDNMTVAALLAKKGAKLGLRDASGNTPLHYCCKNSNVVLASVLLKYKAPVNVANSSGNTPLHEAAMMDCDEMVLLLLDFGASTRARNRQKLTPVLCTMKEEIVAILEDADRSRPFDIFADEKQTSTPKPANRPSSLTSGNRKERSSLHDLLSALEEVDRQRLEKVNASIRQFDQKSSLHPTITRDRSSPRLDNLLLHHLSIQKFDRKSLRSIDMTEPPIPITITGCDESPSNQDRFSVSKPECVVRGETGVVMYVSNYKSRQSVEANTVNVSLGPDEVFINSPQAVSHLKSPLPPRTDAEQQMTASQELLEWKKLSGLAGDATSRDTPTGKMNYSSDLDNSSSPKQQGNDYRSKNKSDQDSELASENSNTESHEDWHTEADRVVNITP